MIVEEPDVEKEEVAALGFNPDKVSLAGAKAAIAAWEAGEYSADWLEAMGKHFSKMLAQRPGPTPDDRSDGS